MLPNFTTFIPNCSLHLQRLSAPASSNPPSPAASPLPRAWSVGDMQRPAHQPFLTKIQRLGLQVQSLWQEHRPRPATKTIGTPSIDAPASPQPDKDRSLRMAKIQAAEQFFQGLPWQPLPKHGEITQASALLSKSKVPATCMEITFRAPASSVMPFMMQNIPEYQNWLPVIKEMKVIEKPSEFERILEIQTYGKFGFGKRHAFALATFDARDNETRIVLEHLPDHQRSQRSSNSPELKYFKSLMSFSPDASDDKSTKFTYYNHTDPNIRKAPTKMILSESLDNNRSFVELCTTKLVDSQFPQP